MNDLSNILRIFSSMHILTVQPFKQHILDTRIYIVKQIPWQKKKQKKNIHDTVYIIQLDPKYQSVFVYSHAIPRYPNVLQYGHGYWWPDLKVSIIRNTKKHESMILFIGKTKQK